ncbi:MAG: ABC transporter ATP-binding protein [Acidisphaera sp.]|nr:ABC transporter ATP-binding protein [Acidisphaera sp.]
MLEVTDLVAGYGRSAVLRGVSLRVPAGGLVGLLGPNGAGKTTLARAISGLLACRSGSVRFDGRPVHRLRAQEIVGLGLLHVPQGRLLFPEMTVQENLEMGAYRADSRAAVQQGFDRVHTLFPILAERRFQLAGALSGGQQQMLAIGRALMLRPRLLMLDEPSIGLAPLVIDEIFAVIRRINAEGTAILLAEQNARRVLALAGSSVILESGRVAAEGTGAQLLADDLVRETYLGLH